MNELKGVIIGMVMFIAFFVPGFLMLGIDGIQNYGFMKVTAEVSELVKKEGGVTGRVNSVVAQLNNKGYQIRFSTSSGSPVYGRVDYGDTIMIHYEYKYQGVFGEQSLNTRNKVFNMMRN